MREKHYRSLLKGITWRVVGTLDTILLSWLFTGRWDTALTIGGVEVFTKIFLFYAHERVWLKVPMGRRGLAREKRYRSVVKGISWRICGTVDTIVIAFFITGDFTKAFTIGFAEVFTKIFLYYVHERLWHRARLGRKPPAPLDSAQAPLPAQAQVHG